MGTYIRWCSYYLSRGHEAAACQLLFHTYEWKCSSHFYTELTAGTKYLRTYTRNCSYCVSQRQGVALSEFFIPLDFTPMFCHCNMSRQSSFGRTSCRMLKQRMLQKGQFLSCEQRGSVRLQLYYRFNQSQTANKRPGNTSFHAYVLAINTQLNENRWIPNYIVLECNKYGSNLCLVVRDYSESVSSCC